MADYRSNLPPLIAARADIAHALDVNGGVGVHAASLLNRRLLGVRYRASTLGVWPEYLVLVTMLLYVKIASFRHTVFPSVHLFSVQMSDSKELVFNINCVGFSTEFAVSY
jgi:hypothetical protein